MQTHLTDAELDDICRPLTQHAARVRYLRDVLKLPVARRPDGSPLVKRSDWERQALAGRPASNCPQWSRAA